MLRIVAMDVHVRHAKRDCILKVIHITVQYVMTLKKNEGDVRMDSRIFETGSKFLCEKESAMNEDVVYLCDLANTTLNKSGYDVGIGVKYDGHCYTITVRRPGTYAVMFASDDGAMLYLRGFLEALSLKRRE